MNILRLIYLFIIPLSYIIIANIYLEVVTEEILVDYLDVKIKSERNLINTIQSNLCLILLKELILIEFKIKTYE